MTQQLIQHSSKTNEWYTPPFILDAVRETLGEINLDPASNAIANENVGANHYYTKDDDGLNQPWFGNVFVNPPGGKLGNKSLTKLFWEKAVKEYLAGKTEQTIFLAFSIELLQTSQSFHLPSYHTGNYPVCIPSKRIAFLNSEGNQQKQPSHANCIIYLGDRVWSFEKNFKHIGTVLNTR